MLPATRVTATAVDAFLRVAGFRLYRQYGRQFLKLLHFIDQVFLDDLKKVWKVQSMLTEALHPLRSGKAVTVVR